MNRRTLLKNLPFISTVAVAKAEESEYRTFHRRTPEGWKPVEFESLKPGDVFISDEDPLLYVCDSTPTACDPPGNYQMETHALYRENAPFNVPLKLEPGTYAVEVHGGRSADWCREAEAWMNHNAPEGVRLMVLPPGARLVRRMPEVVHPAGIDDEKIREAEKWWESEYAKQLASRDCCGG
jgi:hypothetical protein